MKKKLLFLLIFFLWVVQTANCETYSFANLSKTIQENVQNYSQEFYGNIPINKVWQDAQRFVYKSHKIDKLQSFEETERTYSGDCKDFTLWILVKLVKFGYPKKKFGFHMFKQKGTSSAHIAPLVKVGNKLKILENNGKWYDAEKNFKWNIKSKASQIFVMNMNGNQKFSFEKVDMNGKKLKLSKKIYDIFK